MSLSVPDGKNPRQLNGFLKYPAGVLFVHDLREQLTQWLTGAYNYTVALGF